MHLGLYSLVGVSIWYLYCSAGPASENVDCATTTERTSERDPNGAGQKGCEALTGMFHGPDVCNLPTDDLVSSGMTTLQECYRKVMSLTSAGQICDGKRDSDGNPTAERKLNFVTFGFNTRQRSFPVCYGKAAGTRPYQEYVDTSSVVHGHFTHCAVVKGSLLLTLIRLRSCTDCADASLY